MRQMNLTELVAMANANNALMDGTMAPIRSLVERHDVVVALWQDPRQPEGVGIKIIKGLPIIEIAAAAEEDVQCRVTAIKCVDRDQAYGLSLIWGERPTIERLN
ncbi:hypothetical protein ACE102_33855 [Bradyrhizobium sp. vgs-9]|uniref:hypothetical protein n=1 Tax=Bradyrhizobium sp. vgs-9 TaxID=208389 RepID=UPI0035D48540